MSGQNSGPNRPPLSISTTTARPAVRQHQDRRRGGKPALLLCPDLDCAHVEEAAITAAPDGAVLFNPWRSASAFSSPRGIRPPPSAIRFWRERYIERSWLLYYTLQRVLEHWTEVHCTGKDWQAPAGADRVRPDGLRGPGQPGGRPGDRYRQVVTGATSSHNTKGASLQGCTLLFSAVIGRALAWSP